MAQKKSPWNYNDYQPSMSRLLEKHTEQEIKREYVRLQKIAAKRIEEMGQTEFAETKTYQRNKDRFKPLEELESGELAKALADVHAFTEMQRSTVAGMQKERRDKLKTLKEHGYTFVNKGNFNEFTSFLEERTVKVKGKLYGSDDVAKMWKTTRRKGMTTEQIRKHFDWYVENSKLVNKSKLDSERINPWALRAEERRRSRKR